MANFHDNDWITKNVYAHLKESFNYFPGDRIVGIFAHGSMNYGLDCPDSDVDTKLIVLPSLRDFCFNEPPCSTTHVRENNEHIEFKDLRLILQTFRKQNLNFMEILFTEFKWVNPLYEDQWNQLIENNELIARYNPVYAVKTMAGIAMRKYQSMEHEYPARISVLSKYSYDPKQLHHLLRIEYFLEKYIANETYTKCLHPTLETAKYLQAVKGGLHTLTEARIIAEKSINHVTAMKEEFCKNRVSKCDPTVDKLLDTVQEAIMHNAIYHYFKTED